MSFYNELIIDKDDIVFCNTKTKGKHFIAKAKPGSHYLVTSVYTNNFGTKKYFLIDSESNESFSTDSCLQKVTSLLKEKIVKSEIEKNLIDKFKTAKIGWQDKTYVPVFGSHIYDYSGHPVLTSRDHQAVLIQKMDGEKIWVGKSMVHCNDIKLLMSSSLPPDVEKKGDRSETITFRVPTWFADKKGFIGFDGSE